MCKSYDFHLPLFSVSPHFETAIYHVFINTVGPQVTENKALYLMRDVPSVNQSLMCTATLPQWKVLARFLYILSLHGIIITSVHIFLSFKYKLYCSFNVSGFYLFVYDILIFVFWFVLFAVYFRTKNIAIVKY